MNDKLNESIIEYLDDEIRAYELAIEAEAKQSYSQQYLRKKKSIISVATKREQKAIDNQVNASYKSISHDFKVRRVAILVAVMVMIMAAAVGVVAAAKAYIRYNVEKDEYFWHVTFEKTGEDEASPFEYIEPKVPEGFKEAAKIQQEETFLWIMYENADGDEIQYAQELPDGLAMYFDNEDYTFEVEVINNIEIITVMGKESDTIVFNDGRYVFSLSGTVSDEVLKDMAIEMIERINH